MQKIADLIRDALRADRPLPDVETTRKRFAVNAELDTTMTVGAYLEQGYLRIKERKRKMAKAGMGFLKTTLKIT